MVFHIWKWWPTVPDPPGAVNVKKEDRTFIVDVESVEYFARLSKQYDVMIRTNEKGERWIYLDKYGGRFRQR